MRTRVRLLLLFCSYVLPVLLQNLKIAQLSYFSQIYTFTTNTRNFEELQPVHGSGWLRRGVGVRIQGQ